jgi:site-specific recombinase XerD
LSQVRHFSDWLVRRGYVRRDPTVEIPPIRIPRYLPRAMPANHVARLLTACPDGRAELIVLLMVQEGLRCVEVATLELGDVDRVDRAIRVVGKGGHHRVLPLSDETWCALDRYLNEQPSTAGPVIRNHKIAGAGIAADTISGMVARWMADAGIKRRRRDGTSAHALRHTAATDMLRAGAHLRDVQHALGHRHLATTETYLPLVVHDLRDAMGGRSYRGTAPTEAAAQ